MVIYIPRDPDPEPEVVEEELPDTIEAHLELVKERESKQKMKEDIWEQVFSVKSLKFDQQCESFLCFIKG